MKGLLFQTKVLEPAKTFFFRFLHSIYDILDIEHIISLAIACVSERHARWVHLRNWGQSKMGGP